MKLKLNLNKGAQKLHTKRLEVKRGHILLVDDEPENLDGLQALLEGEGYQVSATTLPQEALKITQEDTVDLIISDQRMPVMLGTELLSAVKRDNDDNVRIILTGHTDMNDLITCINNGLLYRYLVKPWKPEEVLSVVDQGMKKIRIERTVNKLIPSSIWQKLYAGRLDETSLGDGCSVQCTVACVDIRDFNMLSARLTPSQTFYLLSEVMTVLDPLIKEHGGYVSKYFGDGVTVIFDEPDRHALEAVRCVQRFNDELTSLNQRLGDPMSVTSGQPVSLGVGLHTGEALLGTVGASDRLEFTIFGDVVSTACSVEAFSRRLNLHDSCCLALITQATLRSADLKEEAGELEPLGAQRLPNADQAVELFQLSPSPSRS